MVAVRPETLHSELGFSLIEVVVATGLMLAVTAGVFSLINPAHGAFAAQSEIADMQQRLRVGVAAMSRDLTMAGAGAYLGTQSGPLSSFFAPVLPFRQGAANDDPVGTFASDRITLIYVPWTTAQSTLAAPMAPASPTLRVAAESNCPVGDPLCGFVRDMSVLVYDDSGDYGMFTITSATGNVAQVTANKPSSTTFGIGAKVVEAVSRTYYLKTDAATETYRLMHYDGTAAADAPVVDNIVGLSFDYYGDPNPPAIIKPNSDPIGPWTTYGPRPPAPGVKPTAYPAGENCTFTTDGPTQTSRLPTLGAGSLSLVKLAAEQLTDGPWCPDVDNPHRYDADLLRIRKVGITLRVQTAAAALRGPAGVLFVHGGTSKSGNKWAPDAEIHLQMSPRNLNLGR
jgi:hypothetical protein